MLEALRAEVLEANLELVRRGLVIYTFGNASGISREEGLVRHQAERRAVREDDARRHGDRRPRRPHRGRQAEALHRPATRTWRCTARSRRSAASCIRTRGMPPHGRRRGREIPCFGTTHADYFHGPVPVTDPLTPEEIDGGYEANTGVAIMRRLQGCDPLGCPAILVAGHAPFCWGKSVPEAAHNAVIVEELARDGVADADDQSRRAADLGSAAR